MKKILMLVLVLALLLLPNVIATTPQTAGVTTTITAAEKSKFDQILKPIYKIYGFAKYISTIVAAVMLLYAGISFMTSANDPKKRDTAKTIAGFVVMGLIIIWATPLIISLLV